jgi:dienelactone hydrolase
MKYHVSLPVGWSKDKVWPVVVIIPDAARDFAGNLAAFAKARRSRPYILVAPHVVTSGGANARSIGSFRYSEDDWKRVTGAGDYRFDEEGLSAVADDVRRRYGGEDRSYLTGWEAGGHTVWALTFRHPEWFRAVAPVSTNYRGRWLDESAFTANPARGHLPIRVLFCEKKSAPDGWDFLMDQTKTAIKAAEAHGFRTPELKVVAGKPHGPLPEEVLGFFDAVRTALFRRYQRRPARRYRRLRTLFAIDLQFGKLHCRLRFQWRRPCGHC